MDKMEFKFESVTIFIWQKIIKFISKDYDKIQFITCNKVLYSHCYSLFINDIKRKKELQEKYSIYQRIKVTDFFFLNEKEKIKVTKSIESGSALLDALFAGCGLPFASSSVRQYSKKVEQDIYDIVRLMPQSIGYCCGELRCRNWVSPIVAACFNQIIPLDIIELLLKKGANPDTFLNLNGEFIHLISDLENTSLNPIRKKEIQELLIKKYRANPNITPPKKIWECEFILKNNGLKK